MVFWFNKILKSRMMVFSSLTCPEEIGFGSLQFEALRVADAAKRRLVILEQHCFSQASYRRENQLSWI